MSRDNDDGARMIADRARELFGAATADDAGALVASAHAAGEFGSTFLAAPFASLRRGWLAFYVESQQYGGPEEGGWHFTAGELVAAVPCARWSAAGERASTAAETADDGYGGPRFHAEPLAEELADSAPAFWLDPASHAAAVATLAVAVAHIGPRRAQYGLAVHWSDTFPAAYYPAERPRYE